MPGDADDSANTPEPHGGSLHAARLAYPDAPEPWIDLSTGINPIAYPVSPIPADQLTRLPEPADTGALRVAAAATYGVDPAQVAPAPGTGVLIGALPLLWPQAEVAILGPTYAEHARAWRAGGARVRPIEHLSMAGSAGCVVVCRPNNPDGACADRAALLTVADRLAAAGGLLVIDEAFADFMPPGFSLASALPHPALLILRSFGKAYGLAGVRLGFALGAPVRIARLAALLGPWPVSGTAVAIGRAALADTAWRDQATGRLASDAACLDDLLAAAGCVPIGGTCLFRLVRAPDADGLFTRLGRAGVLVRRFAHAPDQLRFGIPGDAAAWSRLTRVLRAG